MDSLINRLELHMRTLEDKVEERSEQYKHEKDRADMLLYQMLPKTVAEKLKKGNVRPKCETLRFLFHVWQKRVHKTGAGDLSFKSRNFIATFSGDLVTFH